MARALRPFAPLLALAFALPLAAQPDAVKNGGFEQGLTAPWGTGQFGGDRPAWWNSGFCDSTGTIDREVRHRGAASLHLVNRSRFASNVYGTTQQPLTVVPGQRYRVELWAKARGLARDGAVNVIVNENWATRPIFLRAGTYGWTRFTGDFTLPSAWAQLRILIEDTGEAWIDDVSVTPVQVPKALEEFGDLATGLGTPLRVSADRKGADVPIEFGVRLIVEPGTFRGPTRLEMSVTDLALPSVDPRVGLARVYSVGAEKSGPLAKPVILDLGVAPDEVVVAEKTDAGWKKVPLYDGDTARVGIYEFSTHYLAAVFRLPFVTPSAGWLRRKEKEATVDPRVAAEREGVTRTRERRRIRESGPTTRAFYGVGERTTKLQKELKSEIRQVLASRRTGLFDLPADSPWTNAELFDYLHGITLPSSQGGYFWNKVERSQDEIRRQVLAEPGRVTPGRLLAIAIDANRGDVRLGVLAANNLLKETTMGGRDYPKMEPGTRKHLEVPALYADVAEKLEPWRTSDTAPAGYHDKMGPLYHLFSAMVAGVWGGTHFSRFAVTGENLLRVTRYEKDNPDPEKGDADLMGAWFARWINEGMPGAENEPEESAAPPKREERAVPAPTLLAGSGTWRVTTADQYGEGPISLVIDVARGTVEGELSGALTSVFQGERTTIGSVGQIRGTYTGGPSGGTLAAKVTFDPRRTDGGRALFALDLTAELRDGVVNGAAVAGVSAWEVSLAQTGDAMRDISADREGRAGPRRRSDAEIRREIEEKRRAQGRRFSFPVAPTDSRPLRR